MGPAVTFVDRASDQVAEVVAQAAMVPGVAQPQGLADAVPPGHCSLQPEMALLQLPIGASEGVPAFDDRFDFAVEAHARDHLIDLISYCWAQCGAKSKDLGCQIIGFG